MIIFNILLGIIAWNLLASSVAIRNKSKPNRLYCGLVGFSGPEPFDIQKIKMLMYINSVERGQDATGIYSPLNGLKKNTDKGWEFVTNGKNVIIQDTLFIGHVRAKTTGSNKIANAHPFERGKYILAHNGTLKNYYALLRSRKLKYTDYEVDSDIVAGCIEADNNFDVLKQIDGAAALLIHDKEISNTMYVFKNKERPLFRGSIGKNMYISSISESLKVIGCANVVEFKDDRLYTIIDGDIVGTPKKIKNDPYEDPISTQNNTSVNTVWPQTPKIFRNEDAPVSCSVNGPNFRLRQALHCMIRSKYNMMVTNADDIELNLIKNKYYKVTQAYNDNCLKIYDDITNEFYICGASSLEVDDIIRQNDLVQALRNIYLVGQQDENAEPIIKKNQIIKVDWSYDDGDAGFECLLPGNRTFHVPKYMLRKLSKDELDVINAPVVETVEVTGHIDDDAPVDIGLQNLDTDPNGMEVDDLFHRNISIYEVDDKLPEFFQRMDLKISNIIAECVLQNAPDDIYKLTVSLMDFNKEMFEEMYKPIEENAE